MKPEVFVQGSAIDWEDLGSGIERKILAYNGQIMMTFIRFKKGAVGAVHKHSHTQVTYVESGSFEVEIGREKKILRTGDSFLIPSNVEHGVVALENAVLIDVFTPMRDDFLDKAR